MRWVLVLLALVGAGISALPAAARPTLQLRADQIRIAYEAPKNPAHENVYKLLKEHKILESFQELLSPVRLPRPLLLKLAGCDGESNAWYEDDAITVCYEYMDDMIKDAPRETLPSGVSRTDAIVGPTLEVFLHEFGHAVFDYLQLPIMGREEDAADQFAAYLLLQFAKEDARRLIGGAAYSYHVDAGKPSTKEVPFADEHGLPAQRFYNVLCIAYGFDEKLFSDLVDKGYLPKARAEGCEDEYQQVEFAMNLLVRPHIDRKLAKRVRAKRLLRFEPE